jgi:hypothetical protein
MKSLLQNVNELDYMIRQLQKLSSRIRSGENVDAWRECNSLIAYVSKNKEELIGSSEKQNA